MVRFFYKILVSRLFLNLGRSGLLLLFAIFFTHSARSQVNYVQNPSLEIYDTCPFSGDQIRFAKYWSAIDSNEYWGNPSGTDGQPEYLNTCDPYANAASVPLNGYFYHYPRTGNGMATVLMFYYQYPQAPNYLRDYLQGRLYKPLTIGKNYCVTFYASQEQQSSYSIKQIGAYLDDGHIDTTHVPGMPQPQYTPQILNNSFVTDTLHWVKIQGSFTANGTEKFITIGNFFNNLQTDTATFNANSLLGNDGYYLIDDVSVIETGTPAYAWNTDTLYKGYLDSVLLGRDEIIPGIKWYRDGVLIDTLNAGIWIKDDTVGSYHTYIVEQTLCGLTTYDTVVVSVQLVNVGTIKNMKDLVVYPNPVQND